MAIGGVQVIAVAGLGVVYNTPSATEQISPDTNLFLHVKNGNASACVVTVTDSSFSDAGNPAVSPTVSVPATTGDRMIPINPFMVNQTTGTIAVTFSVTSSVTAALIKR